MKLLTVGCSFTADNDSWANRLKNIGHDVRNLGLSAAGNKYISDATISELILYNKKYDHVLVMWSGLQRNDYLVDSTVIDMYPECRVRTKKITNNFGYITGGSAIPGDAHPAAVKVKKEIELITNYELKSYQSLLEILKLQSFLQSNSIPYKFMTYVNYWNSKENIINNNVGVYKFQSLTALSDYIDFSQFIFYNDNKDGIYEMCLSQVNFLSSDNFHPSALGHTAWGDFVNSKLLEEQITCLG